MRKILISLNKGVLRGRFETQHVVSGDYIVDFYFPEIRLAIEVDGSIHRTAKQARRDREKDNYCASVDITMLRVSNGEVFGDREQLVEKLRAGWRSALQRKNRIIGTRSPSLDVIPTEVGTHARYSG